MAATLRASKKGLQIVDQAIKMKGWNRHEDAWSGLALTSKATLKRFWRRIPIKRDYFIDICKAVELENWEDVVDNSPTSQTDSIPEFFAYDDAWVGREQLVAKLTQKVQGNRSGGAPAAHHPASFGGKDLRVLAWVSKTSTQIW